MDNINEVHVQHYIPRPGDKLIVRCTHVLAQGQRQSVARAVRRWVGSDAVDILVLDPTITMEVETAIDP